jgi:pilus assembly protein CpaE
LPYKKNTAVKTAKSKVLHSKKIGRLISVFSTKGGAGKTTIALNLAVDIVKKSDKRVALVDLDLQFGDIAIMANLEPEKTIADLMEETSDIDQAIIHGFMIEYMPNLMILPSPPSPEYAEYVSGETMRNVLELLRQSYDYVIIDTASNFSDVTLSALDSSDEILMVSPMDIVSVKNVKIGLEIMKSLEYPDEKVKILVNMANSKLGISYSDLERIFEKKISYMIPEGKKSLTKAVNKGEPHINIKGPNRTNKAFDRITKSILRS